MRHHVLLIFTAVLVGCSTEAPVDTSQSKSNGSSTLDRDGDVATINGFAEGDSAASDGPEIFVIDVRSKEEWDGGHVEQAILIPHTEIAERISEVTNDKEARIVVYCAAGGRAGEAKADIEELGFTNVENGGGYDDVKERFN